MHNTVLPTIFLKNHQILILLKISGFLCKLQNIIHKKI